jgi:hypothetical protein
MPDAAVPEAGLGVYVVVQPPVLLESMLTVYWKYPAELTGGNVISFVEELSLAPL